jgi:Type-F conjugative transfer system protein (TrbI_Ftype)
MYKNIAISILTALVTSLGIQTFSPKIATVDVLSITSQFIKEEANKSHTPLEREAAIKAFSHNLESALQKLAHSKSCILLPKEAILTGSRDYTAELKKIMEKSP